MTKKRFGKTLRVDIDQRLDAGILDQLSTLSESSVILPNLSGEDSNLKDADCLLVSFNVKIGHALLAQAPKLKYIGVLGTNLGNIDIDAAQKQGIAVVNIQDYCTNAVAEFIFAAILEHLRELERGKIQARAGNYSESGFSATELRGKTFGILGLGRIGTRVAELALAFGARVQYYSRDRKHDAESRGILFEDIDTVISTSDFLSINLTHSRDTINFLHKERIALIKKGAVVINTCSMELVDITALGERLGKNDMTFILDHSDEMSNEDLLMLSKHKNCIIYPPIAYVTEEAKKAKQEIFVRNITGFLANGS